MNEAADQNWSTRASGCTGGGEVCCRGSNFTDRARVEARVEARVGGRMAFPASVVGRVRARVKQAALSAGFDSSRRRRSSGSPRFPGSQTGSWRQIRSTHSLHVIDIKCILCSEPIYTTECAGRSGRLQAHQKGSLSCTLPHRRRQTSRNAVCHREPPS